VKTGGSKKISSKISLGRDIGSVANRNGPEMKKKAMIARGLLWESFEARFGGLLAQMRSH